MESKLVIKSLEICLSFFNVKNMQTNKQKCILRKFLPINNKFSKSCMLILYRSLDVLFKIPELQFPEQLWTVIMNLQLTELTAFEILCRKLPHPFYSCFLPSFFFLLLTVTQIWLLACHSSFYCSSAFKQRIDCTVAS